MFDLILGLLIFEWVFEMNTSLRFGSHYRAINPITGQETRGKRLRGKRESSCKREDLKFLTIIIGCIVIIPSVQQLATNTLHIQTRGEVIGTCLKWWLPW